MLDVTQKKLRSGLIGGVALVVVLGAFWHFHGGHAAAPEVHDTVSPVRVAKVERRDMSVVEHTLGIIIANATVQVTPRVQGILESADFKEGQFVKKGELLFQIDPRPFQAALNEARASLRRDEALLENAHRDLSRYQGLYGKHFISAQLHDTSATNVNVLAATVAQDKGALDLAQLNLGYTQIHSPINGKTGPLLVQPGNMVTANGSTIGGTALVTIAQIKPVKLSFNLPQSDLPLIQARLKSHSILARIDLSDASGIPLSAPVDFTSNAINNESGTIELRANFPNADLSLLPGQLVNVTVTLNDIPHALVVPHDAIDDGPDGPYVYTVINGRAVTRPVKILFDDSRSVAIAVDLKPGDPVIVEGQLRVVAGGKVQVFAADGASSGSESSGASTQTGVGVGKPR